MAQNYTSPVNKLFIQFGTDKAIPELWGDYVMYGPNRMIEGIIDLTKLSTSATVLSNTTFFPAMPASPAGLYIEKIELITEVATATSTSATLNMGLIQVDRSTVPSGYGTALLNGVVNSTTATLATITTITTGGTAGSLIGSGPASATGPYYITAATSTGTYSGGTLRVRIFYHPLNVLTTAANISQ